MNNFKGVLCISVVLLTGCSANEWSRVDNSEFQEVDLDIALKECRYKEIMKKTNLSVITANSGASSKIRPTDNEEELAIELERVQKSNRSSNKANSEMKHRSLNSASQAYQCVVEKGFVRL